MWAAATALCAALILPAQKVDSAESLLQAATKKELVDGNLTAAIEGYKKALTAAGSNRAVAAKALLRLGECYEKQGNAEARRAYERLVKEFSDQKEQARDAGARLAAMGGGGSAGYAGCLDRPEGRWQGIFPVPRRPVLHVPGLGHGELGPA
jgi:tetratricopeptide (TPR) repeat protein